MLKSIRWRLIGSYLLVTLLAMLALGVVLLSIVGNYFVQQERAYLTSNAMALAGRVAYFLRPEPRLSELEAAVSTFAFLGQARIEVLDAEQKVLVDSGPRTPAGYIMIAGGPTSAPVEGKVLTLYTVISSGEAPQVVTDTLPTGERVILLRASTAPLGSGFTFHQVEVEYPPGSELEPRAVEGEISYASPTLRREAEFTTSDQEVTVPIMGRDGPLGYVRLSEGPAYGKQVLASVRTALLWATLVASFLAVGIGLVIGRGLTSPLVGLARIAQRMGGGELHLRAPVTSGNEIGQLAQQFNQMAERLAENFAALEADREALRRFVADASHELRSPITALKTFNELLMGKTREESERQQFLRETQEQIERLDWVTRNLLDLSKLDSGLMQMDVVEEDIRELVDKVVAIFQPQAEEEGVSLTIDLPSEPLLVPHDRARLEQVLENLLQNAIKFTPSGGKITVGADRHKETAEVWVEDTGVGICKEDLPHVFERFYRGRNGRERGGSGLGLAIVKAIVGAHGGQVKVTSKEGKGSRFSFTLWLKPQSS